MVDNAELTMCSNYPPCNIRKTGKDNCVIEFALTGFIKIDVKVEFEDCLQDQFTIAEDVKINGTKLKRSLLAIACEIIILKYKKKLK